MYACMYYCDIAWSNLLQQDIDRLPRLQKRSAWIITRCSSEAIVQLHWRVFPAYALTTRANSFFSLVKYSFLVIFYYILIEHNYGSQVNVWGYPQQTSIRNLGKEAFFLHQSKHFEQSPFKHCQGWKHSNVLPPSKTFFVIVTLLLYFYLAFNVIV